MAADEKYIDIHRLPGTRFKIAVQGRQSGLQESGKLRIAEARHSNTLRDLLDDRRQRKEAFVDVRALRARYLKAVLE